MDADQGEQDNQTAPEKPKRIKRPKPQARQALIPGLGLTPRQETFAQEFVRTGSFTTAYRTAYSADNMRPNVVHSCAWKLANQNPAVSNRINELQRKKEQTELHNGAKLRALALSRLTTEAENGDTSAARIKAAELLGKVRGVGLFDNGEKPVDNGDKPLSELTAELGALLESLINQSLIDVTPASAGTPSKGETVPIIDVTADETPAPEPETASAATPPEGHQPE